MSVTGENGIVLRALRRATRQRPQRYSSPRLLLLTLYSALILPLSAQHYNFPINHYSQYMLRTGESKVDSATLTSLRSQPESWLRLDSVRGYMDERAKTYSVAEAKLYADHLINLEKEELDLHVDLLLNFELGTEQKDESPYADSSRFSRNMRGFIVRGNIGEKVSFETSFRENQSRLPTYLRRRIERYDMRPGGTLGVAPGGGRVKPFSGGVDHAIAEGYLSYSPIEELNIQFGHQKNFIGQGHRSLLLSDNAYTYPQLKITTRLWQDRIRYQTISAGLQSLSRLPLGDTPEALFQRKGASFHYLEIHPLPSISLGFFEGTMWKTHDRLEGSVSPPAHRYVPLIGLNTMINGLDDIDNSLIGLDLGFRILPGLTAYGQYAVDDADASAYQVGLRTIDLGLDGLQLQAEYNTIDPGMYAYRDALQSYTQMTQGLAHPAGANLDELTLGITYFYSRWFMDLRYTHIEQAQDIVDSTSYGSDINLPRPEVFSEKAPISIIDQVFMRAGYLFNPKSNFMLYVGWRYRDEAGPGPLSRNSLFVFGLEMYLFERYEDY